MRYTVSDFAALTGSSRETVVRKIEQDELLAIKEGDEWVVFVDCPDFLLSGGIGNPDTVTHATRRTEFNGAGAQANSDEVLSVTHANEREPHRSSGDPLEAAGPVPMSVTVPVSPVDLTLLINLVSDLTHRNTELLNSTADWRARVQELEERLFALTSGTGAVGEFAEGNASTEQLGLDVERSRREAAEAECIRLRDELGELKRHRAQLGHVFEDPTWMKANGWQYTTAEPPHQPWWRRLLRMS